MMAGGPARAGALIYALDLERLADFYETLLSMSRLHADAEHVVLSNADFQLILHAIPPPYASGIVVESPPLPREETPIKLFFTVASLLAAEQEAARLGGRLFENEWQGPGFRVRNGCDPEGNIFQLRESLA
jgi:predicted enzyme related to lactoylglutathione lyase